MTENKLGEIAMEIISDHPLYASTCGISYDEAIAIAKIVAQTNDLVAYKEKIDRFSSLSYKEMKKELRSNNGYYN